MRNESRFDIESRAYSGLQDLLEKARRAVRADFDAAGMSFAPLPSLEFSMSEGQTPSCRGLRFRP